jgi:hypothetical protein
LKIVGGKLDVDLLVDVLVAISGSNLAQADDKFAGTIHVFTGMPNFHNIHGVEGYGRRGLDELPSLVRLYQHTQFRLGN